MLGTVLVASVGSKLTTSKGGCRLANNSTNGRATPSWVSRPRGLLLVEFPENLGLFCREGAFCCRCRFERRRCRLSVPLDASPLEIQGMMTSISKATKDTAVIKFGI